MEYGASLKCFELMMAKRKYKLVADIAGVNALCKGGFVK